MVSFGMMAKQSNSLGYRPSSPQSASAGSSFSRYDCHIGAYVKSSHKRLGLLTTQPESVRLLSPALPRTYQAATIRPRDTSSIDHAFTCTPSHLNSWLPLQWLLPKTTTYRLLVLLLWRRGIASYHDSSTSSRNKNGVCTLLLRSPRYLYLGCTTTSPRGTSCEITHHTSMWCYQCCRTENWIRQPQPLPIDVI